MFQLIGGTLAALAIVLALGGSPLAGTALAGATLLWVLVARPAPRRVASPAAVPWSAGYAVTRVGT